MKTFGLPALVIFSLLLIKVANCQHDSISAPTTPISFSAFADIFYAYDLNRPQGEVRQPFLFNHNRHNEFNLNLGLITASIHTKKYRASFGLQVGTYAVDNYAAEAPVMRNVNEAFAGIALNRKQSIWLDAGIFGSHIGFESAISSDNPTLTRSLAAENSPYFLTGAKLTWSPNKHWQFLTVVCNGWQRIRRVSGNSLLSVGTQVNYTRGEKFTLNWSTFTGTDDPDTLRRMRYFNNLYTIFQLSKKFKLTGGFDIGIQQTAKNSSTYDKWYTPVMIVQYKFNSQWATALRVEYYKDNSGVIIYPDFATAGFSLNVDYSPANNVICRLEGRTLNGNSAIFINENLNPTESNSFIAGSMAISF